MADVVGAILRVLAGIRGVAEEGITENDRQAWRLFKRVTAIEPSLLAVQAGTKLSSSTPLRQLLAKVEKIRNFLEGYALHTTKFNRALERKANAADFKKLGATLTAGMHALHLDVAADVWAREDASDRLEDLENMVDMMERMERNRTNNHEEVTRVLKALRRDERSELKVWAEIDSDTDLKAWVEIDFDEDLDFEGSTRLGSGGFGEVRTAKWNGSDVAVKHLLADGLRRDDIRALRKEIRLHSNLHSDYVVQLHAASTIPPHLCLVTEFASGGSLWEYLRSTSEPLEHALQAAFLCDIAQGMSFLHTKGILHGDLRSSNVLVFDNGRLKLCDFGLSKIKTESSSTKRGVVGTAPWMSPEEMDESPANERTDVYSFGVVCFEVAARAEPFKGLKQAQVVRAVADKGKRPQMPEGASASPDVVALMEQCWKHDPADRPEGFMPVVEALESVLSRDGDPRTDGAPAEDAAQPRFRFPVSQSAFLVISDDDANDVLRLVNKTGLCKREPADVCGKLMSMAEGGVLSRAAFDEFIRRMVPASSLDSEEMTSFAVLLSSVFTCFDRDRSSSADANELASGFSLLCAGSKSAKLDFAFRLHDEDGDGRLTRRGLWRYTRSFLTALMALSSVSLDLTAVEFTHAVNDGAVLTSEAIFAGTATDRQTPDKIEFNEIAAWYTEGGFRVSPWLELLDTNKWRVPTTPSPVSAAADGAPAVPAPAAGAADAA